MNTYYSYFTETKPEEYRFLSFYQYRSRQKDFTFSFQKEADILRKCLDFLKKMSPEDVKKLVDLLLQGFDVSYIKIFGRMTRSMGDFQQSREGVKLT